MHIHILLCTSSTPTVDHRPIVFPDPVLIGVRLCFSCFANVVFPSFSWDGMPFHPTLQRHHADDTSHRASLQFLERKEGRFFPSYVEERCDS